MSYNRLIIVPNFVAMFLFSRNFITSACTRTRRGGRKINPGLHYQISLQGNVEEEIKHSPEGFGDMESDMFEIHKTHKHFEQEMENQKDMIRKLVVKSKYFRNIQLPNFLTFAEKEQIKLLHGNDPEQWSVEVLAECFPANCEIIRKVLKAQWKPKSVKSHDEAVVRNWEHLRKGNIELPKELETHLKKFSSRQLESTIKENAVQERRNTPNSKEFSSIVKSLSANSEADKKYEQLKAQLPMLGEADDTALLAKVVDKKLMRFNDLKIHVSDIKHSVNENPHHSSPNLSNVDVNTEDSKTKLSQKFVHEIEISNEDKARFEMSPVKNRIHIPRKIYRKGATYRIDDSYYDDDGEFLYRVPGMTRAVKE
ncbi:uncharacterized protein LOC142219913 [Haematobia irritans]|uniref:uncharacterized protein LOC142219913 n=1 Tax=Haematobia irritans TaxID=7368 RepID=UPI003F4FFD35